MLLQYDQDYKINFIHSEQYVANAQLLNAVGATDTSYRNVSYEASSAVFVKADGSDTTGDGTSGTPYATICKAAEECNSSKRIVVVMDSEEYNEKSIPMGNNYCEQLLAENGQTPVIIPNFVDAEYSEAEILATMYTTSTDSVYVSHTQSNIIKLSTGNYVQCVGKASLSDPSKQIQIVATIFDTDLNPIIFEKELTHITDLHVSIGKLLITPLSDGKFAVVYDAARGITGTVTHSIHAALFDANATKLLDLNIISTYSAGVNSIATQCIGTIKDDIWFLHTDVDAYSNVYLRFFNWGTPGATVTFTGSNPSIKILAYGNDYVYLAYYSSPTTVLRKYNSAGTLLDEQSSRDDMSYGLQVLPYAYNGGYIGVNYVNKYIYKYDSEFNVESSYTDGSSYTALITFNDTNVFACTSFGDDTTLTVFDDTLTNKGSYVGTSIVLYYEYNINCGRVLVNEEDYILYSTGTTSPLIDMVKKISSYHINMIEATSTSTAINGVILDANNTYHVKNFVYSNNAPLDIQYTTFRNARNYLGEVVIESHAIDTSSKLSFNNCLFSDLYSGIIANSNEIASSYCAFLRVKNGVVLESNGAGSSLVFDHHTFHNNYAGILFSNNDGDENIKNSVFYDNVNYATSTSTGIAITNSCVNDDNYGSSLGTGSLNQNPRFINEGYAVEADVDLRLRTKALGYPYDSPALGIADDTTDAGCYLVDYTYELPSATSFSVDKADNINISYKPNNNVRQVMIDGTVKTYNASLTQEIEFKWTGMLNADFQNVLSMIYANDPLIKIYLQPETSPTDYITVQLVYSEINGSPKSKWQLSRTGVQDVKLVFERKYTE